jgi:hypothetical protein
MPDATEGPRKDDERPEQKAAREFVESYIPDKNLRHQQYWSAWDWGLYRDILPLVQKAGEAESLENFAASDAALIALLAFHLKEQIAHVKNLSDPYGMTTWRTERAEKLLKENGLMK